MATQDLKRQTSLSAEPTKTVKAVNVAVNEIPSDSESAKSNSFEITQSTTSHQITRVIEVACTAKERVVCEVDDVDHTYFRTVDVESYLAYIANERLLHLPHRGSHWDKVLKYAEFFGLQVCSFGEAIAPFVPNSQETYHTALASCQILLELGHNQAQALATSFGVLYELGLLVAQTIRTHDLKSANNLAKEDLGEVYATLVSLVAEIAIYYRQRINSMTTGAVKIDFFGVFGASIDRIYAKKEDVSNHMWSSKLHHKKSSMKIETIRRKLKTVDQSARGVLLERFATAGARAEETCEWVQGYLLDFFRSTDQIFTITGAEGCGKSTLAGWIKDRLQSPLGRKSYETISFTFPFDAPAEATSLACVKALLSQLLDRNVGDVHLYEELVKSYETFSRTRDVKKLEDELWHALKCGLETMYSSKVNMVIIVDGLDEIRGGDHAARELHKRVHKAVKETARTRAITLGRPISNLTSPGVKHFVITRDQTHDDIELYVEQALRHETHFKDQSHQDRSKFVDSLVHKARGSFLWASLVLRSLRKESSHNGFLNIATSSPTELDKLTTTLLGKIDFKQSTTRVIFALMLAADRPFRTSELTELLQLDVFKKTTRSERFDLQAHLKATCDHFIVERQGVVRFRHSAIRRALLGYASKGGELLMSMKEAHSELTTRMLLYAKICLHQNYEPTIDGLTGAVVEETFHGHGLLEYVVRSWLEHFRLSTMYHEKDELSLTTHFKGIFPESAFFALLERHCWHHETTCTEVVHHHDLALRIRTGCFGENHASVLQTLLVIGSFHREMSRHVEAAKYFYQASCIGQSILYKFSTIVVACTNIFLTCTETITITERTEIVTYREKMIRFMIEICKCKHGESSDHVIRWYKVLAELYISIKEEHHAHTCYQELHQIIIIRFGKGSREARDISEKLGGLTVVVRGGHSGKDVVKYHEFLFETSEDMEVTDKLRISITIQLALEYEARGEWFLAEQLYINFWRRISEICRVKETTEIHISKITIAIAYAKFLQRIKRVEEASNILICLWAEYEHYHCESETLIVRIKEIGLLFRTWGLLQVAVSVFSKVWGFFKRIGKHTHEEAVSTTIIITEIVEEITETTTTTTTTETTTTETVVREIFETTYTRSKHSGVDKSFFKSCMALISLYICQQKWSEVGVIIRRSLELTWKAILTVETELHLSGEYVTELISMVMKLALCHHRQGHFEKAETFYLRIYRACIVSLHIEHVHVQEVSMALVHFYEQHHRHEKAIKIYIELLGHYRKHLGHSHKLTIKTLYALGSLCALYGHKDAYDYYIEIVTVLNKDGHCHHDAFEACIVLIKHYYEMKRWTELHKVCAMLWETFIHRHHEFSFTAEIIETLYERYVYVLEYHAKVEFSVLYKLTVQYCETVTKFAGVTAAIVTVAMLALAGICEKHEKHYHESVTIYEEVINRITTTATKITITTETVKKRLTKMYVKVITTSTTCSKETVDRGITLCFEIYEKLKTELGCYHETTLLRLKKLVLLYMKAGHSHKIVQLLQASVLEIISTVTTSIALYQAAITLASIYVLAGERECGQSLLHQLRHLIVLHNLGSTEVVTIKLGCKVGKAALVFLAAYEMALYETVALTYSEVMADILLETVLYEQYTRLIKTETKIEVLLQYGAQLRGFWSLKKRTHNVSALDAKLFERFLSHFGSHIKTQREVTFSFYLALVAELSIVRTSASFDHHTLLVSTSKVSSLLKSGEFQEAYEVAQCAFQLCSSRGLYSSVHGLSHGYKLAELLAGRDGAPRPNNAALRESMLALSRAVLSHVLDAARRNGVSFVSLKFADLNGLVGLLGAQKNYAELETLLAALWTSREVQRTWTSDTVLAIGNALVHAHQAAGHTDRAIRLAEDIAYNLRRSRGPLDILARAAGRLLAGLYSSAGRHKDAMDVHEEVLREIDEEDDSHFAAVAREETDLLKRTWIRNDGWHKSERNYRKLFERLTRVGVKEDIGNWKGGETDGLGKYKGWEEWNLLKKSEKNQKRDQRKRASDLWVCGYKPGELIRA